MRYPPDLIRVDRLASDDAVHPVAVDDRDVAGAVIAVRVECLGGGLRPIQVAVEQHGAANVQLADGFAVVRHLAAVIVDQPGLHAGQRQAHPARATLSVGQRRQRDERLRGAIPLDGLMPGQLRQPVEHRHRQRGASRYQQPREPQRRGRRLVGHHP